MFKKLSSKLRRSSAGDSSESSHPNSAATSPSAPVESVDRVALYRLLQDNFTETEMMDLAQSLNVDYGKLRASVYSGKTRELIVHLERRGRLKELLATCRQLRPDVDWATTQASNDQTSSSVAASESDPYWQLLNLLRSHFSYEELANLGHALGVEVNTLARGSMSTTCRLLVVHLAEQGRLPELLELMKQQRPQVAQIQDFSPLRLSRLEGVVHERPDHSIRVKTPGNAPPQEPTEEYAHLHQLLTEKLNESQLSIIFFDADVGAELEDFPGYDYARKTSALCTYLERRAGDPEGS